MAKKPPVNGFKEAAMREKTCNLVSNFQKVDKKLDEFVEEEKKSYQKWKVEEKKA